MRKEQFAVYEIEPAHGSIKNGIILGPFATKEEAQSAGVKYGYSVDNYYVNSMNKERYNQIINEAYENYTQTKIIKTDGGETHISPIGHYNGMTKEEFINKCKTDPEFSEKWGLKIEERELSLDDRSQYLFYKTDLSKLYLIQPTEEQLNKENIPTKLITLAYNNEKIESYE